MAIEFTVEMAELRKKVNFVRNGLGSSKTDLQVMLFRFNITGNKMSVFAASKEIFTRTEIRISRDEDPKDGTFAVLGAKLVALVGSTEVERVTFKADAENVEITAGFLTVNLVQYDGGPLRQIENGVAEHLTKEGTVLPRAAFEEAIVCAKSCTAANSIRPDVAHVELRNGRFLSSDGRKIMIYTNDAFDTAVKFKIPSSVLNDVIASVKNIEAESVAVFDHGTYYYLKAGLNEYSIGIRKVERDFPAVEGQIERQPTPDDEVSIDKNVFEGMLSGVALGLDTDEVRVNVDVGGAGTEAYLEVSGKNSLGRRSYERASCGRTAEQGKQVGFPVSFRHLLSTLSVFKGDSVVDLTVILAGQFVMVRDVNPTREITTIIPFRTDAAVDAEKKEAAAVELARKKAAEERSDSAAEGADAALAAIADNAQSDIDV